VVDAHGRPNTAENCSKDKLDYLIHSICFPLDGGGVRAQPWSLFAEEAKVAADIL
jgi:hypothetical protein